MIRPTIFRGLWCQCGEVPSPGTQTHVQEAKYYVGVSNDSRHVYALGPFQEHDEALAHVDEVHDYVQEHYPDNGRAHWYGFGTCRILYPPFPEGRLNQEILNRTAQEEAA